MAALNPATCALCTLSSKLHPPLIINTKGCLVSFGIEIILFVSGEHASKGSATYNFPHFAGPTIGSAETQTQIFI